MVYRGTSLHRHNQAVRLARANRRRGAVALHYINCKATELHFVKQLSCVVSSNSVALCKAIELLFVKQLSCFEQAQPGGAARTRERLIRNSAPLGPYSRTMPRALWSPWGGGLFLMSEVPLYAC